MDLVVLIGEYLIFLPIALSIILFLLNKENHKKMIVFGSIVVVLIIILTLISSNLFYDTRPFVLNGMIPLISHVADNGFPSDHVLIVAGIMIILLPFFKKTSLFIGTIGILIGIARIYAQIHTPIDILGSFVIAIISGLIGYYLYNKLFSSRSIKFFGS